MPTLATPFGYNSTKLDIVVRARRVGWAMAGEQKLADKLVLASLERAHEAGCESSDALFLRVFRDLDQVLGARGVVSVLSRRRVRNMDAGADPLHGLSHLQRIAICLLAMEGMSVEEAAQLSERPVFVLEQALFSAETMLDAVAA